MSTGDHDAVVQLAALRAEIDRAVTPRLDRIEGKVDRIAESHYGLRGRVAGWAAAVGGAVALAVSVVVAVAG